MVRQTESYEVVTGTQPSYDHVLGRTTGGSAPYRNVSKIELMWLSLPDTALNVRGAGGGRFRYVRVPVSSQENPIELDVGTLAEEASSLLRGHSYRLSSSSLLEVRLGDDDDADNTFVRLPSVFVVPVAPTPTLSYVARDPDTKEIVFQGVVALTERPEHVVEVTVEQGRYTPQQAVTALNSRLSSVGAQVVLRIDSQGLRATAEAFGSTAAFYLLPYDDGEVANDVFRLLGFVVHQQPVQLLLPGERNSSTQSFLVVAPGYVLHRSYSGVRVRVGRDLPAHPSDSSFVVPFEALSGTPLPAAAVANPIALKPPRDVATPLRVALSTLPDDRPYDTLGHPHAMLLRITHEGALP